MELNKMVKNFDVFDIGLVKWSVAAAVLLIAKYWPDVTSLAWYWYAIAFVAFVIRPLMHMFKE